MKVQIGKGIELDVDTSKLPTNVMEHVQYIGLRNILMDAHASITTDEADYQAKAQAASEKKLAAMYAGEVRVAGTREGDPVRAEALRMATAMIKSALKLAGRNPSKVDPKAMRASAEKLVDVALLEKAKARVEENRALKADIDVSGL